MNESLSFFPLVPGTPWQGNESLFRTVFEHAATGVALTEPGGRILIANRCYCEALGYSEDELRNQNVFTISHPEDLPACREAAEQLRRGLINTIAVDKRYLHRDGHAVWMRVRASTVRDADGRALYNIVITDDISEPKAWEQALWDSRAQLQAAFEQATVGLVHLSIRERRFLAVNEALCRVTGYSRAELLEMRAGDLRFPDEPTLAPERFTDLLAGIIPHLTLEQRFLRKDGTLVWGRATVSVVRDELGEPQYFLGIVEDITDAKLAEQARQKTQRRLQLAVGIAELGDWEWDLETNEVYFSPLYKKQLGYAPDELENQYEEWASRLHPEDRSRVLLHLQRHVAKATPEFELEFRLRHRSGEYRWILARTITERNAAGKVHKLTGIHLDLTERKLSDQRIREAAQHDPLTGLPNRALVFGYTQRLLAAADRNHLEGALLFIDLDRFKPVNDLYGHEVGDQLLRQVARRLTECTRDEDVVGRLGGDEFVVVLPHLDSSQRSATVAKHVLANISRPFRIGNLTLHISPSVGISHFPRDADDVDGLIHTADLAMYHAKQNGRGRYCFYTEELAAQRSRTAVIEACLKRAMANNGLSLSYQPVIDLNSGELAAVEALLRLTDERGGDIAPEDFIPVAEAAGLIVPLGEWVAAEACRQHAAWTRQGLPATTIAINVSPLQFRQKQFSERLIAIVMASGMEPSALQIEVTESTIMDNVDDAILTLEQIKAYGIKVSLDDFGTGYSSLSQLSSLPLDKLKVDKSFVQNLGNDRTSRAITEAIIALGRALNLEIVGEGIESPAALNHLRENGCHQAQGFLLCPPLSADEFVHWHDARSCSFIA